MVLAFSFRMFGDELAQFVEARSEIGTVVVSPRGGRLALSAIATLIREAGGLLVATAPEGRYPIVPAFRLRIAAASIGDIARLLTRHGHHVLGSASMQAAT
jgi:hypothetical protein